MTVLCATHFSEAAQRATTAAALLARKLDEPLFLVHVLSGDLSRALGRSLNESASEALQQEVRRLEALGARVSHQLLTGEAAEELARFAKEKGAGLVVTAGPTSASPFLGVGGTVDRLATSLAVPLLVVRDPAPFEAWVAGTRPLKVMLGVERSQPFEAARDWLQGLRRYGPVEVVAGRIYWPHEEYQRLGLVHPMAFQDVTSELTRVLEQEVRTLASPLDLAEGPVRVRLEAGVGRIADHLVTLAAEEGVDVLVVGSHQRRGLGKLWSVSHHALRLATMAVASIPATAAARGSAVSIPALRSVLVATDFSESANRAIPYAFSLLPNGGTVYLVTVGGDASYVVQSERDLRQRLHQLVPRDGDGHGRKVQVEVLAGQDVATVLLQAAQRLDADVICVGRHGRSGPLAPAMGSVAKAVLSQADRPVLVVRPPEG